jgi:hypothetical protein
MTMFRQTNHEADDTIKGRTREGVGRTSPGRLARRIRCRLRGHLDESRSVSAGGAIVVVPVCTRCGRVDVDAIEISSWNRKQRRQRARAVAKHIVDGTGK